MNIEDIKERHKQDEIDMGKISKGQLYEDRAYLLSIIEQAEKDLKEMSTNSHRYHTFHHLHFGVTQALKSIQGEG